jgi:hypothetical protein
MERYMPWRQMKVKLMCRLKSSYYIFKVHNIYFVLMHTFTRLCNFDFNANFSELHSPPWIILDAPRFPIPMTPYQ